SPRSQLVGELAREADLRGLRRCIRLDPGQADAKAGAARDVDDASAARRFHAGRNGLRAIEGAGHVDVEDRLPLLRRDLLERPAPLAEHAAGIVDQDVHAARRRGRLRDAVVDGGAIANIGPYGVTAAAGRTA